MQVVHDPENLRFYVSVDGKEAELNYSLNGAVMDIHRTFTPPELRGQGLASVVTKAGLDWAREQKLKVIPTCPYVETFIRRYSEYEDLI